MSRSVKSGSRMYDEPKDVVRSSERAHNKRIVVDIRLGGDGTRPYGKGFTNQYWFKRWDPAPQRSALRVTRRRDGSLE